MKDVNTFRELCTELTVGYNVRARYSAKVYYVPDEVFAVRQKQTEVVPRIYIRPLNFAEDGFFLFVLEDEERMNEHADYRNFAEKCGFLSE